MAHSVTEWLTALQQVMPRGKAWPRDNDADLNRFLRALAARLTRIEYDASRLHVEMRPETTLQLLPEWEQYLALPECGIAATTTEARRRAVVEKYRRKGGLATWQIEAAAAALGFTIKVTAVLPHHCLRDCMYPLHPARYRWLLKVEVQDSDAGRFTCVDDVMTPLISGRTRELECLLKNYRMGGTGYEFFYTDGNDEAVSGPPLSVNRIQIQAGYKPEEPLTVNCAGLHFALVPALTGKPLTINRINFYAARPTAEPLVLSRAQLHSGLPTTDPMTMNSAQLQTGYRTRSPVPVNSMQLQTASRTRDPLLINHPGLHFAVVTSE